MLRTWLSSGTMIAGREPSSEIGDTGYGEMAELKEFVENWRSAVVWT